MDVWILWSIIIAIITLDIIFICFALLLENRDPSKTLAWLFMFVAFPFVGYVLFLLFGMNWRKAKRFKLRPKERSQLLEQLKKYVHEQKKILAERDDQEGRLMHTLLSMDDGAMVTSKNKVQFLDSREETFKLLLKKISDAKEYIYLEYYIWQSDAIGR